jgi:hypothetical protein
VHPLTPIGPFTHNYPFWTPSPFGHRHTKVTCSLPIGPSKTHLYPHPEGTTTHSDWSIHIQFPLLDTFHFWTLPTWSPHDIHMVTTLSPHGHRMVRFEEHTTQTRVSIIYFFIKFSSISLNNYSLHQGHQINYFIQFFYFFPLSSSHFLPFPSILTFFHLSPIFSPYTPPGTTSHK